jgi:SUN domain-containing protein 1/2
MEQLQEKLTAQTAKLEQQTKLLNEKDRVESQQQQQLPHQTAELILNNPKLQEELKVLIQSSHADISFQKIEEYVDKTFYLYNADRTGMTDFASESIGGSILFTRCTEVYTENSRWFTVFDVPISRLTVSPRVVIQGTVQPGNCWGFKGHKGDLFIKLAAQITPTAFSLEHIPKELSINGKIDSAPQNFTVYVMLTFSTSTEFFQN